MERINAQHTFAHSENLIARNLKEMKGYFPEVFREGKILFDELKEILGGHVEQREERFNFTWNGKQKASLEAQKPSSGTLRPNTRDSLAWGQTQNLYLEGDNLEVLKLLQRSYYGKVKLIYIDPPYNTGKDFVYKDNYRDNLKNYLELTGQLDEKGRKFSTNSDLSGRYHSDWLNMMYPRLKLARHLMRDDGVIFISIDDNEVDNLRMVCNEIYGEGNFVANVVWQKRYSPTNDTKGFSPMHDHILVYRKSEKFQRNLLPRTEKQNKLYKHNDDDGRGFWQSGDLLVKSFSQSRVFPIVHPETKKEYFPPRGSCWRGSPETIGKWLQENRIYFGKNGKGVPRLKRYLNEVQNGRVPTTWWNFQEFGHNDAAIKELRSLFGTKPPFDTPKPSALLKQIALIGMGKDDLALDFFSGSGTLAHALMDLNQEDGGNRKFILVQLPEPTDEKSVAFQSGFKTIAEIGKERIRKVASKIHETAKEDPALQHRIAQGAIDLGFKAFRLDSSNVRTWEANAADLALSLLDYVDHIKPDRFPNDLLYEILLKHGLALTSPVECLELNSKTVFDVGSGELYVCMENEISIDTVEAIGKQHEKSACSYCRVIFMDAAFSDDAAKANAILALKQYGITEVKSI